MGSQGLHRAAAHARRGVSGAGRRHERGDWGRSWSLGAVALVVGIGVVLGGCSTPAPEVEKTPSVVSEAPSPTSTPTPVPTGPVKPERPADMDRTDEVGAAAAATYFLELYPYVMATGDLEEWERVSMTESCELCTAVMEHVADYETTGNQYVGGAVSVEIIRTYALDTLYGGYPVDVRLVQEGASVISPDGAVIEDEPAEDSKLRVELIHDGESWRLAGVSNDVQGS